MSKDRIMAFARQQGYDSIAELKPWRGYEVYEPLFEDDGMACVGLPLVILVKGDEIRMSTPEEAIQNIENSDG